MAGASVKPTRVQGVYDRIREDLLNGELTPGSKLKINDLATQNGVSVSVVREAVIRLAGEGLVRATPQRGFAVATLSIEDLQDLTRARVLIETLALAESIKSGDLAWESTVLATHHALARTPVFATDGHVHPEWTVAHRTFHHALLAGCGTARLEAVATGLRDCAELYRHWSQEFAREATRDIAGEHRTIAELTVARDEAGATQALREHIERTSAALVRYVEQAGGHDEQCSIA